MRSIFLSLVFAASTASLSAQSSSPLIAGSQAINNQIRNSILRSADKVPDDMWSFQPTPEVRTFGQVLAHIADGQYEFCGVSAEGKSVDKGVEKSAKTKAQITAALKEAFAYCDAAYAKLTPASAVETVDFFGRRMSRITVLDFNSAHNDEHYGNLVTYMRLKGIVPPSSEPKK